MPRRPTRQEAERALITARRMGAWTGGLVVLALVLASTSIWTALILVGAAALLWSLGSPSTVLEALEEDTPVSDDDSTNL